ncbi:dynein regulatory complex subunit 6 isoform X2 [Sphaerodactylus townsendi]|uniref:dynein regulatory complex subunit 6 isoform X2 n=1 Tax=Sphaerodactylus townsendi TaxID=933632 RepID=UPI0020274926|nr:dynein regulatory complex subunit 6 isoform X2 [Sphaerodactylus townsendi]
MSTFRNTDPAVRIYFQKYSIPDIYEALLSGLLLMCPDDPLRFLEEKIKEMMGNGLTGVLWNMCIDPTLSLRLKVISETYLHTLLGLDDDQLMTIELCQKAWNFHTTNLKRKCFEAWRHYGAMRKSAHVILEKKMTAARGFYKGRVLRQGLRKWKDWMHFRKKQHKLAASRIGKVFTLTLQKATLSAWRREACYNRRAKKCIAHLQKKDIEETDKQLHAEIHERRPSERRLSERRPSERRFPERRFSDRRPTAERLLHFDRNVPARLTGLAKLPQNALVQIFQYLNLIDLGRCSQVCQSWNTMTHVCSIWSSINFSQVKDKIEDHIGGNILLKWRACVVHLNLHSCAALQWHTFKSIGLCKNLQELNVSKCQGLNDELMRLVSEGCPALLHLNLSHTDITNGTLRLLSRSFSNLQHLNLAYCRKFTDKGLQYLGSGRGCHKLIYLDLSGCLQITVEGFKSIAKSCSGIQHLVINEMPTLTDRCIQALVGKCQKIISVEFNEAPHVSDIAFKALAECQLIKIKIEGSNRVTDLSFKMMSKHWPCLDRIGMIDCQKITDTGLKLIAPLANVAVLNLSDCTRISDAGLKSFAEGFAGSKIRELTLANCSTITDNTLIIIAERCIRLVYLNLRSCHAVTDTGIEVLTMLPSLTHINISGIDISDHTLDALGRNGKIKEIIVSECRSISDTGIKRFCIDAKNLDYMDLSFCQQLSNQSIKHLSFNCHKLTSLSMVGCSKASSFQVYIKTPEI